MPSVAELEPEVSQETKKLGELSQDDLDRITDITGATVVVNVPPLNGQLRRVSLIHHGRVISIDARDWRHNVSEGPFFSIFSEDATQNEFPTLSNPLVTIAPDLVTVTEVSVGDGGRVVSRSVEISKDRLGLAICDLDS